MSFSGLYTAVTTIFVLVLIVNSQVIISESLTFDKSKLLMDSLTRMNMPPPWLCLSLRYTVYPLGNISLFSKLLSSHDSVPIITWGLLHSTNVWNSNTLFFILRQFIHKKDNASSVARGGEVRDWLKNT